MSLKHSFVCRKYFPVEYQELVYIVQNNLQGDPFKLKWELNVSRTPQQNFVKVLLYHSCLVLLVTLPSLPSNSFFYISTSCHKNNVNDFKDQTKS